MIAAMNRTFLSAIAMALLAGAAGIDASGGVGVYGIIDKVVFEPGDRAPERAQVWGVFAYVDPRIEGAEGVSPVKRGYLYFKLPADAKLAETARREWMDLRSVAATGQAVGFGLWGYVGGFRGLDPGGATNGRGYILHADGGQNVPADLRVRPETEKPAAPVVYQTNVGVVKLPPQGSRADLVRRLQEQARQR
jgi:hypothetical protein